MSNHLNRFNDAVSALVGHGDVKQRLIKAFNEYLADIDADELPVEVASAFTELRRLMSGVAPLNGEGPIRATVRKMSIPEADACAQQMLGIYSELLRQDDQSQEVLPFKHADDDVVTPVVPPFLVKSV